MLFAEKPMINPLHLFWIIPLSASIGFVITALLIVGEDDCDK